MLYTNKAISIVCILLSAVSVHAALIARDSEQTLTYRPQTIGIGHSAFGLRSRYIQSSKRLNNQGKEEKLGHMFEDKGVNENGNYSRDYEIEASYLQLTPFWTYGLTSDWSIFVGIPIYQVQTKASHTERSEPAPNANSKTVKTKNKAPEAPENDSNEMFIGQAIMSTQYIALQTRSHKIGFTQKLRFPSAGRDDSVYFTHGAPEALGYGAGAGLNYEYLSGQGFNVIASAEALVNFNDDIYVRSSSGELTEAERRPGDIYQVRASVEKNILPASYIQVGFLIEQKTADEIEFQVENRAAYERAEAQRLLLAYEYRPEFSRHSWQENVVSSRISYSHFLSGINVAAENSAALEFQITY